MTSLTTSYGTDDLRKQIGLCKQPRAAAILTAVYNWLEGYKTIDVDLEPHEFVDMCVAGEYPRTSGTLSVESILGESSIVVSDGVSGVRVNLTPRVVAKLINDLRYVLYVQLTEGLEEE